MWWIRNIRREHREGVSAAPPRSGLRSSPLGPCQSGSLPETPITPACTTDASWVSRSCQWLSWLLTAPEQMTCEKSQRCCDTHVQSLHTLLPGWCLREGELALLCLLSCLEMPLTGPFLEPENKGGSGSRKTDLLASLHCKGHYTEETVILRWHATQRSGETLTDGKSQLCQGESLGFFFSSVRVGGKKK